MNKFQNIKELNFYKEAITSLQELSKSCPKDLDNGFNLKLYQLEDELKENIAILEKKNAEYKVVTSLNKILELNDDEILKRVKKISGYNDWKISYQNSISESDRVSHFERLGVVDDGSTMISLSFHHPHVRYQLLYIKLCVCAGYITGCAFSENSDGYFPSSDDYISYEDFIAIN